MMFGIDDVRQHRVRERSPDHRGDLRGLARRFLQPIETRHHDTLQGVRHFDLGHIVAHLPRAALVARSAPFSMKVRSTSSR